MRPMRRTLPIVSVLAAACATAPPPKLAEVAMDEVSRPYVTLVLSMGLHDPGYVDAYYGPPEWQKEVEAMKPPLAAIKGDARTLLARLRAVVPAGDELGRQRYHFLVKQVEALIARADMLEGRRFSFDQESKALYDAVAPVVPDARFEEITGRLNQLVPGDPAVPLATRLEEMRKAFIIPRDKLDAVFAAAIKECRERTLKHVALPDGESFTIEYVTGKPWSGYNWYKGDYRSVIQINTDLPIFIERAIDLACHEGYPGHHAFNVLLEKNLVKERGWTEFSVYPLYSPMSLIAEGTANYGIEVAFPGEERVEFERKVLYPLAGLDPAMAPTYHQVTSILEELQHVQTQAARQLVDGKLDAAAAADYLTRYALSEPERAKKSVAFIQQNRSYVINYSAGKDLVKAWVQKQGGDPWEALKRLLTAPTVASDLTDG